MSHFYIILSVVEYVKKYISEAFFILLDKKELSKITINELIKKAGVCKASFYRNYSSYDNIIYDYLNSFFSSFPLMFSQDNFTMKEHVKEMLLYLFSQRKKFNILNKRNLIYHAEHYIFDKVNEYITTYKEFFNVGNLLFFSGGISALILNWVKGYFKGSSDELTSIIINSYQRNKKSE